MLRNGKSNKNFQICKILKIPQINLQKIFNHRYHNYTTKYTSAINRTTLHGTHFIVNTYSQSGLSLNGIQ